MPPAPVGSLPRDFWPRVLLSPVFGTVIPLSTGLIDVSRHPPASLAGSFVYFSLTAWLVWEGNRQIYLRLPHREDWLERPWRRITMLLGAIVLYTIPISTALLLLWRLITGDPGIRPLALPMAVLAIVTAVTIITHVYETVFLLHDWETDRLRSARIERERAETALEALKREVDPHFLFNNLNALTHLIEQRDDRALTFVEALSAAYRYVLEARRRPLVALEEELDALRRHLVLASIRYGNAIVLDIDVPPEAGWRWSLPPVTLGELLTNALKHNRASGANPLDLRVSLEGSSLAVSNDYRPRTSQPGRSTGIGLENLAERHRLAIGARPTWGVQDGRFTVMLPLAAGQGVSPAAATVGSA